MDKKLYRDEYHKKVGGVCAGLAEHFGMDVSTVRILFVVFAVLLKGAGVIIYAILWAVLPKKTVAFQSPIVDYTVPPMGVTPDPQFFQQPKKRSTGGIIAGTIMVMLGGFFLLDEFDIIPDWDIAHLWPLILIAIGAIIIFSGKKQPWEHKDWNQADAPVKEAPVKEDPFTTNSTNDNPSTL